MQPQAGKVWHNKPLLISAAAAALHLLSTTWTSSGSCLHVRSKQPDGVLFRGFVLQAGHQRHGCERSTCYSHCCSSLSCSGGWNLKICCCRKQSGGCVFLAKPVGLPCFQVPIARCCKHTHSLFSAVVSTAIIKPELRSSNIVTSCWNLAVIFFHQCMIVTTRIDGQTALSSSSCY